MVAICGGYMVFCDYRFFLYMESILSHIQSVAIDYCYMWFSSFFFSRKVLEEF